jgi:hypothetical protein
MVETWRKPSATAKPGTRAATTAVLLPAVLRHAFSTSCQHVEAHVNVVTAHAAKANVTAYATSPAERQHRRHTWTRRRQYNALSPDDDVNIQFLVDRRAGRLVRLGQRQHIWTRTASKCLQY